MQILGFLTTFTNTQQPEPLRHPLLASLKDPVTLLLGFLAFVVAALGHLNTLNKRQQDKRAATLSFFNDNREVLDRERGLVRNLTRSSRKAALTEMTRLLGAKHPALLSSYTHGRGVSLSSMRQLDPQLRIQIERLLVNPTWPIHDDSYRPIINLMNILEDLANAIYQGICDLQTADKMYGRLIAELYQESAYMVHRMQRRFGPRTYDQLERLIDDLSEAAASIYILKGLALRFILLASGPKAWKFIGKSYSTHSHLLVDLSTFSSLERANSIALRARRPIVTISPLDLNNSDHLHSISLLFAEILRANHGGWPVILPLGSGRQFSDDERIQIIDRWFQQNHLHHTSIAFGAWYQLSNGKPQLVGYVGVEKLSEDSEPQHTHWDNDLRSAVTALGDNEEDLRAALHELWIPISKSKESPWLLDPASFAILKSLGVHPKFRKRKVGRLLFRAALRHIRTEMRRSTLLDVIADDPMTEEAVRLYDSEGGEYIGSAQDRQIASAHRMFFYVF